MADMATPTAPEAPVRRGADWLESWTPEDPDTWDSGRAWKTLWVTTFNLTLAFATWFLVSALAPKLNNIGYDLSKGQLYWLVAIPGLAGGTLRLIWTFLPPIMGTRKLVTITSALFVLPAIGWGLAVQNPDTPYASCCSWPPWPASAAARSPGSCPRRRTSSPRPSRAPPWGCRRASATSA